MGLPGEKIAPGSGIESLQEVILSEMVNLGKTHVLWAPNLEN